VQSSSPGSQVYLKDTVVFSQNGTPYYTSSFNGAVNSASTVFDPVLVPVNQTATAPAYFEDQTGFGGFISAGLDQTIHTASSNEDTLVLGFDRTQTKFVYTGNDLLPFNFFLINSEYGSTSTFSGINMDEGVLTKGSRGFIITSQNQCRRFDTEIPDQVFQVNLLNNGSERFTSQRDFINEWVYFTYPSNMWQTSKFPNQTLQFNYRDNSWSIFDECYTAYGLFRQSTGYTWATIGDYFPTWSEWNEPWNAGSTTLLQPQVIGGNQQGFVLFRDDGTSEGNSLYIQSFSGSTVTSPDHGLNFGDYIIISNCLGTIGAQVNSKIFRVDGTVTANTFDLDPSIGSGTYLGGGLIKRMYVPQIQSKQFPVAWEMSRKTRLGPQQYLFTKTSTAQITLQIFLSMNGADPYNINNNALVNSSILYTCPESTNLGLTPANVNLIMPTATQQEQIWHRKNISLIGDVVQVGFTLSDEQMRHLSDSSTTVTITGVTQAYPCVLTANNAYVAGELIKITGVQGMIQLNFDDQEQNYYSIVSATPTTITINVDSSAFTAYAGSGTANLVFEDYQFAEIEIHGFILDITPSQVLA
jgi:hypothetical protein